MKKILLITFVVFTFCMCKNNKSSLNNQILSDEFLNDEFKRFTTQKIPEYLEYKFPHNWYERNIDIILKANPNFKVDNFDSLKYIIVPSLNIAVDQLKGYNSDLFSYLEKGELSINNSELLVFEKDSLLVKFSIRDGFSETRDGIYKSDCNEYLKNSTLDVFNKSEIYFNIKITDNTAVFSFAGIIIRTDNEYTVLSPSGTKYPLEEMYKPFFKNQKEFDQHIKNIVKYN